MKLPLAAALIAITIPTFAKAQSSEATSIPGCGAANIEFNVKTDSKKHPAVQPDAGKAEIFFLQDDSEFFSRPRPTTRFGIDGMWVGATHSNSYFYATIEPGEHHLCASWQGFLGLVPQRREAALHFTAEAGMSYYVQAKDVANPNAGRPVAVLLKQLDSDEGKLLDNQFSFSTSSPKK